MEAKQKLPQMKLRLPHALKQWVKEMAARNRRSENGEVVFQLEQSRAQQQAREVTA